jgi:hypothetical protein
MFGGTLLASAGYFDTDVFLLKYNPSGVLVYAKRAGGTGNDIGYGIDIANNGAIFIDGVFHGTKSFGDNILTRVSGSNGFIAKFESSGKMAWSRETNGMGYNEYSKVSTDASGSCYVSGFFSSEVLLGTTKITSNGGKDACIAKYDSKGSLMWVLQGGGTEDDEGMCITTDKAGVCYMAGQFNTAASFGRMKVSGWLLNDIFISRIK